MSAIGQILACPKCGTMLEIKPPPGWQPPAGSEVDDDKAGEQPETSQSSGSFDDIEKILDRTHAEQAAINRIRQVPVARPKRAAKPIQSPVSPPADDPILPTNQWTSAESQRRKKWLAIVSAVVGGILVCFAIVVAVINSGKKNDSAVTVLAAENDEAGISTPENVSADDKDPNEPPPEAVAEPVLPLVDNEPVPEPAKVSETPKDGKPAKEVETIRMPPPTVGTQPPPVLAPDSPLDRMPTNGSPLADPAQPAETRPSNLSNLDLLRSEMGELSELLEESGTSILKIQDLAEANRELQLIGIPKYFIEQPEAERLDLSKQLALRCGGVRYIDTSLIVVLRDLTAITGIPFALETDSILTHRESTTADVLNPKINIDLKDVDFAAVIDAIVGPLGLVKSASENQCLIIKAPSDAGFVEKKYDLASFSLNDEQFGKQLVVIIQGLFSPQSWLEEPEPATIKLEGNEVTVSNTIFVHRQIEIFIKKLQASIQLKEDLLNAEAQAILRTKWNAVAQKLEQPLGLPKSTDRLLTTYLNKILEQSGVTVLVDWEALVPLGWTPATRVPGDIEEDSLGESLRQLARSMHLTLRALDASTLELTTFERARKRLTWRFTTSEQ